MKIKTSELIGPALDWAVAEIEHAQVVLDGDGDSVLCEYGGTAYNPSEDWTIAGPIIYAQSISTFRLDDQIVVDAAGFDTGKRRPVWGASLERHYSGPEFNSYGEAVGRVYTVDHSDVVVGPTQLIAAMRAYVASRLGDEVEIPEELT
ncbi:MAG: DUF2591 family protein [FCB group bacterium]|jgi:hypothetical protein|nr:DUF2591 family protein [FCB group bacterium]